MAHLEPSMIRGTTSTPWVTASNETQLLELGACSLCLLYANIDVESPPFVDHFPRKPWASTLVYPRVNIYILENLVEKKRGFQFGNVPSNQWMAGNLPVLPLQDHLHIIRHHGR